MHLESLFHSKGYHFKNRLPHLSGRINLQNKDLIPRYNKLHTLLDGFAPFFIKDQLPSKRFYSFYQIRHDHLIEEECRPLLIYYVLF